MILSTLAQIAGITGTLLTTPVASPVTCTINQAAIINIRPQTKEIQYDLEKTSIELGQLQSNTISPYGLNVDQTTGGLRHDQPIIKTVLKYNVVEDPRTQTICMSYHTINVDIQLQPKIYIAKEFNKGRCAREVIKHEKKHVTVDRKVINKYSKAMGKAIEKAVNEAGVVGPFPASRSAEMQQMMGSHIENALSSIKLYMTNEMNNLQQQVDSLEEYESVNQYCERASKKAYQNKQKALKKQRR